MKELLKIVFILWIFAAPSFASEVLPNYLSKISINKLCEPSSEIISKDICNCRWQTTALLLDSTHLGLALVIQDIFLVNREIKEREMIQKLYDRFGMAYIKFQKRAFFESAENIGTEAIEICKGKDQGIPTTK